MMSDVLSVLLAEKDWLLADGAMGTNLFQRGLQTGEAPDLWNIDNPEKVMDVHQSFVDAGADIILTNSFGANALRLKLHGDQDRVTEINRAAAELARRVADHAGRPVVVGGSMGPTGEIMEPVGPLSMVDAEQAFHEQAAALAEGGADVLWIETSHPKKNIRPPLQVPLRPGYPLLGR